MGTAGVEGLLVQDHAAYRQEHAEGTELTSSGQIFVFLFGCAAWDVLQNIQRCSENTAGTSFLSKEASAEGNVPDPGGRSCSVVSGD